MTAATSGRLGTPARGRHPFLLSTAALALHLAWASTALTAPAATSEPTASEVVITGKAAEVVDRIDKRIYDVEGDPQSRSGMALDILRKLPQVTVSPRGEIALRGDVGVTVLVDGKPVSSEALQRMPARQMSRVEVMVSPTAQYDPNGTAGIINIVTRKKAPPGLTGTATASMDTRGFANAGLSTSLALDRLTLRGGLSATHARSRVVYSSRQETLGGAGVTLDRLDQTTVSRVTGDSIDGDAAAAYRLSEHGTLTLTAKGWKAATDWRSHGAYSGTSVLDDLETTSSSIGRTTQVDLDLTYVLDAGPAGGVLTLTASGEQKDDRDRGTILSSYASPAIPGGVVLSRSNQHKTSRLLKGDYDRTFPGKLVLNAGLTWQRDLSLRAGAASGSDPLFMAYDRRFAGVQTVAGVYATLQLPLGHWTVLPGLRIETTRRSFLSGGLAPKSAETNLFPSLHLSHAVGPNATLKASYARRIQRLDVQSYDPTLVQDGLRSAFRGNPALKPRTVDVYDLSYNYDRGGFSVIAAAYYRVRHNTLETSQADLGGGVILISLFNGGDQHLAGLALTAQGRFGQSGLGSRWKYSANVYVSDLRVDTPTGTRQSVSWSGDTTLQYDSHPAGPGGDHFQLRLDGYGPSVGTASSQKGAWELGFSYEHPLSTRWSVVVSGTDIFKTYRNDNGYASPLLRVENRGEPQNQALKIAMVWKLGGE